MSTTGYSQWFRDGASSDLSVEDTSTTVTAVSLVTFTSGAVVTAGGAGEAVVAVHGDPITATDGSTSVSPVTVLTFISGATIIDLGAGNTGILIAGGLTGARITMETDPVDIDNAAVPFDNVTFDTSSFVSLPTFVIPSGMSGIYRVTCELYVYTGLDTTDSGKWIANIVRQIGGTGTPAVIATCDINFQANDGENVSFLMVADMVELDETDVVWAYFQNFNTGANPQGYVVGGVAPLADNYLSLQYLGAVP